MDVLFDVSILSHSVGGISRYLISLSGAVAQIADSEGIRFRCIDVPAAHPGTVAPPVPCDRLPTPLYMKVPLFRRLPIRLGWEERSRGRRLGRRFPACSIYHHHGVQPCSPPAGRSVVTIYDTSAIEHPEWHTDDTVAYVNREMEIIRNGAGVVAISRWTAERISERLDIPPERICIAGGAADDTFSPGDASGSVMSQYDLSPGEYLLHVGSLVPRKNIPFLISIYRQAVEKGLDYPLVLVGSRGWGDVEVDPCKSVRHLSNIDEETLLNLYRGARALLFPSEHEGLGFPALEALACNTPVVASNSSALAETVGSSGMLLETGHSEQWLSALLDLQDAGVIQRLRELARVSGRPRWSDVARELCGFYRSFSSG